MLPLRHYILLAVCAVVLASCGQSIAPVDNSDPGSALPSLSSLHPGGARRGVSATEFELLTSPPVSKSQLGALPGAGQIILSPPSDDFSWAIYGLQGIPTDGSVVPVSIVIDRSAPCWVGVADFDKNRWELVRSDTNGAITPAALDMVSQSGTCYVAVLGIAGVGNPSGSCTVNSLKVTTSADLVLPTAALKTISATGDLAAGIPSFFTAEGSDPGSGAGYTSITFDWHDLSVPDLTTDPLTEVSHTWTASGPQQVTVTVLNDQGKSNSRTYDITLIEPFREMLVVYNSDIPESLDLANYYNSTRNGRGIDPAYVLGLPMGLDANADFDRATYESLIRDPIKSWLDASGHKDTIKYILLFKGVPHRISDGAGSASVDSELCLLYSDLGPSGGGYPYNDWLENDPKGLVFGGQGFYMATNFDFVPNTLQVCYDPTYDMPDSGDEVPYTLNYLVGRLSAYTYDEAKLMVDRSIGADKTGQGWAILDSEPGTYGADSDTMVDPVWPWPDNSHDSGAELLANAGYNVYAEVTTDLVNNNYPNLPAGAGSNVLAYCSWGVHAGHPADYITNELQFTYLPGACFMSYESFNAWNFNGDNLGNNAGQGQICDFLRAGGTCAIGNCWEPYTIGVGDERWVYSRYIIHGDRWIEAAYKGLRLLSWMEVVVGDPLCKVK